MTDTSAHEKKSTSLIRKFTGMILLLAMAAVFLFSGISKLYAFEPFVWNIMDAGISGFSTASVAARLFIGLELLLGLFLTAHLFLRSFTYPAIIGLLVLFTVYLIILIFRQGNSGDCGCFGEAYSMRPSEAIVKNIIMIGATILLMIIYPVRPYKNAEWIAAVSGMAALVVPFIFFPLSQDTKPTVVHEPVNLTPLYHSSHPENVKPEVDLRRGKHIIAFMSLTCPHCKKAAFSLQVIHRRYPDLPIFMVLNGNPLFLEDFFRETHSEKVPHILFRGPEEFQSMAGMYVPAIYWINNSVIERKSNYFQLDPKNMEAWVGRIRN